MFSKYTTIFPAMLLFCLVAQSQDLYFPPVSGDAWETLDPSSLDWCQEKLDSLYNYLDRVDTKSFLILKDGRMVVEKYFDDYNASSVWYYASAGKSVTSVMVGIAQQEGLLHLDDPTADYLGKGWTSCTPQQEEAITIRHQLSMTSGLDDSIENLSGNENCLDPRCLIYKAEPDTRWAYHNAPYRLLQDVVGIASDMSYNQYYYSRLASKIGMGGLWVDYILYGKARDMARFGLLTLARGSWDGNAILSDTAFFKAMVNSSQDINKAYGYLWWLNGKETYQLPGLQFRFPGKLIPNAPDDMFAALGKNDQKIYVVPSLGMVVVRQGNSAGGITPALSSFDNELWARILDLECQTTAAHSQDAQGAELVVFPSPFSNHLNLSCNKPVGTIQLYNAQGVMVGEKLVDDERKISWNLDGSLPAGMYILMVKGVNFVHCEKLYKTLD